MSHRDTYYPVSKARIVECYHAAKRGLRIPTNIWHTPYWEPERFLRWFSGCATARSNRDDPRANWRKMQFTYQGDLCHDARIINDFARRIRWPGSNLLRTPELRERYPHVNTQRIDE